MTAKTKSGFAGARDKSTGRASRSDEREERLAAALRVNLHKRKMQARARQPDPNATRPDPGIAGPRDTAGPRDSGSPSDAED